jgi:hypothetical protein
VSPFCLSTPVYHTIEDYYLSMQSGHQRARNTARPAQAQEPASANRTARRRKRQCSQLQEADAALQDTSTSSIHAHWNPSFSLRGDHFARQSSSGGSNMMSSKKQLCPSNGHDSSHLRRSLLISIAKIVPLLHRVRIPSTIPRTCYVTAQ